ncbi:hypothetical protein [Crocosphaera sp.]|uniref:glycosyltransferase family 39 protein n=1 Tax=Crocosphaera sp. TaxID=2729996 RepID=UPI0026339174|nr:hypothetical protein [Crocosphaera sp.]MDJ0579271.1 hypothetical protein [Crocosphaera sp.]
MNKDNLKKFFPPISRWWHFFILAVLIIGIFFRLFNIDTKVFWPDETDSLLRISGNSQQVLSQEVFNNGIITAEDLQRKYQNVVPEKNLGHVLESLSKDVHPPLYFILARWWFMLVSPWVTSITAIRSFSVFISFLVFPAVYWLCLELFNSPFIGYIAISIFAIDSIF